MLEIVNLTKSFGKKMVLNKLNLKVAKKERLVIIGPSGCGKTTLLRCINGLEKPTKGKIIFEKNNLWANKKEQFKIRQKMGMIFQNYNLFPHLTVKENITLALTKLKIKTEKDAEKIASSILEKVNLLDKINDYPKTLSGGEKQRVAIARTLAMNPEIILVDEPTGALDPKMIYEVTTLLQNIASDGMTMVIISHEMNFVKQIATRVIFLKDGKIFEEGPPNEILENPKTQELKDFLKD